MTSDPTTYYTQRLDAESRAFDEARDRCRRWGDLVGLMQARPVTLGFFAGAALGDALILWGLVQHLPALLRLGMFHLGLALAWGVLQTVLLLLARRQLAAMSHHARSFEAILLAWQQEVHP